MSATTINLGRLSLASHILDRNSYRLDLKIVKCINTPKKTINVVGFNKNLTFEPLYSIYTDFDGSTGIVQVEMKKRMLGLFKFVIWLYLRNDITLAANSIVFPLESGRCTYIEYDSMGSRGNWTDHKLIKITMSATEENKNEFFNPMRDCQTTCSTLV